eukprot:TRINITY_DN11907_c0_g2_i2.p1 TRINITY_DN11907_c0_g2~~TRINITY_DN11907_c0_g2_i2.p1  ORF type:complete len:155 (+),score=9.70 TRINITY_DN11907_c0_g2_i2:714-1178(+)
MTISELSEIESYDYSTTFIRTLVLNVHQSMLKLMNESLRTIAASIFKDFDTNSKNNTLIYFIFLSVYAVLTAALFIFGRSLSNITSKNEELLLSVPIKDCVNLQGEANGFLKMLKVRCDHTIERASECRRRERRLPNDSQRNSSCHQYWCCTEE